MGRLIVILLVITTLVFLIYSFAKKNIVDKITGQFKKINIKGVNLNLTNPTLDISVDFDILNSSTFSFTLNDVQISIFNNITKELSAKSTVKKQVDIGVGTTPIEIDLKNVPILSNGSAYFEENMDFYVVVEFTVFGIKIKTEEIVKF